MSAREKMVRLTKAAAIARMSYQQMLNKVLRQEVRGYQDSNGRWWASEADAQRLAQPRDSVPVAT